MPEKRLQRTREAYKKDIYYYPCERYTEHVIDKSTKKCIFCERTELELKLGPIQEVPGY